MIRFDDLRLVTLASVGLISALLWWMLAASMGDMVMPTDLTIGNFIGTSIMWIIMMLAMMLPAMAPVLVQYAKLAARETTGAALAVRVSLFGTGYFALWAVASVILAGAQLGLARTDAFTMGGTLATPMAAGVLAIAAGLWQFTPIKDVCLTHCRRPLAWLLSHWREGLGGAFPMGARHGAYCVGCCIALMGLMFVFGAMNVLWMAVIAAYFVLEKIAPAAERWSRIVGWVLVIGGAATVMLSL
jgi:predicted metal-binding membrane protein